MIRVLDQNTIDKIAAGEVIERPMSIVKELVENSIDAGATSVTVEIKDGGISYIRVTDNGCGIDPSEVRTSCLRHATSKLETADDLCGIMTLGFRGEALSTISAVTETEMITKTPDNLTGVKYIISGGREVEFSETGAPDGTTIISKNIFFNTPARLKFLKTSMTEGSYINDLITRIALSHPAVSMRLISNGKTILNTSGNDSLKDTIYAVYGKDITRNLLPVDYTEGNIRISGFVGKPFVAKGNRSFENYFVNGRYITNAAIYKAIEEAYKTYIMQHRFPFTVLFLSLDPKLCDVNIHPAKREFKYGNEKELFSAVYHAVADALKEREFIPEWKEESKDTQNANLQNENIYQNQSVLQNKNALQSQSVSQNQNVSQKQTNTQFMNASGNSDSLQSTNKSYDSAKLQSTSDSKSKPQAYNKPAPDLSSIGRPKHGSYSILEKLLPPEYRNELNEQAAYNAKKPEPNKNDEGKIFEGIHQETEQEKIIAGEQKNLFNDDYLSKEALSHHRVIGLAFDTYWITQYNDTLYLMDQHAAHEKVNYERFLKAFKENNIASQRLFPPEIISLTAFEMNAVRENIDRFAAAGFEIDEFGGNEVKINAMPVNMAGINGRDIFLEFVSYLTDNKSGVTEDIFVHKLATMGCKAAVKGGQHISQQEAQHLIEELLTLDNPYTCPHGRPTIIKYTKQELDKKFKRIVGGD